MYILKYFFEFLINLLKKLFTFQYLFAVEKLIKGKKGDESTTDMKMVTL